MTSSGDETGKKEGMARSPASPPVARVGGIEREDAVPVGTQALNDVDQSTSIPASFAYARFLDDREVADLNTESLVRHRHPTRSAAGTVATPQDEATESALVDHCARIEHGLA
jgi:hypothetical protein